MRKLSPNKVCEMARTFEGVTEKDHFGSDAFFANGRIFATVWHDKDEVNLMLNQEQQRSLLVDDNGEGFKQIENAWGKNAINVQLDAVDPKVLAEALRVAWLNSANKRSSAGTPKKRPPAKKTLRPKKLRSKR
jgi:hypothetical protein